MSAAPRAATGSSGKPVRGSVFEGSVAAGAVVDELGVVVAAGAGVGAGVVVVPDFFCFG
jgi:hypothetical protein